MTVTMDFGNAEWCDVGHILCASSFSATGGSTVAHFIAPDVPSRAIATGIISNKKAL